MAYVYLIPLRDAQAKRDTILSEIVILKNLLINDSTVDDEKLIVALESRESELYIQGLLIRELKITTDMERINVEREASIKSANRRFNIR